MTYEVRLARRAIKDLRSIYGYIHADSSAAAAAWFRGLEAEVFSLETHPHRGVVIRGSKALRHLLYGNKPHLYRIIYVIDEPARVAYVAQIRHGARKPLPPTRSKSR